MGGLSGKYGRVIGLVLAGAVFSGAVHAQAFSTRDARKQLFSANKNAVKVEILPGALTPTQTALMKTIIANMKDNGLSNYYGAIAVSPVFFEKITSQPLEAAQSGLFQLTERRHSLAAAERIAMTACREAAKSANAAPCLLAARILPKRYKPRAFSLSVLATRAFKDFRKIRGPKAFAVSDFGVAFGSAKGAGATQAAVAACNARVKGDAPRDCRVVVLD